MKADLACGFSMFPMMPPPQPPEGGGGKVERQASITPFKKDKKRTPRPPPGISGTVANLVISPDWFAQGENQKTWSFWSPGTAKNLFYNTFFSTWFFLLKKKGLFLRLVSFFKAETHFPASDWIQYRLGQWSWISRALL